MPVVSQSITRPIVPVGRDDGDLGVAEAVPLAQRQGTVPDPLGRRDEGGVGAVGRVERDRSDRQTFVGRCVRHGRRGGGCG